MTLQQPEPTQARRTTRDRNADLAERFGTPLYVYDLDRVAAARRALFDALPEEFDLFYALKANPHPDVARALREGPGRACRAEISSTGELRAALTAGYRADECLYTGPGKTAAELHEAIGLGVRMFSVESAGDLRHIGAAATAHDTVARCLLRVNSPSASATTGARMTGTPSQFGIDAETLPELMPELSSVPGTRLVGAHFFPLSNASDEAALTAEFEHTLALAAELRDTVGLPLEFLDIGGGFSVPYGVPGERAVYDKLRTSLEAALDLHLPEWRAGSPRLACESGRYLVGDSGQLLCGVVNTKVSRGRTFVILDGGINVFGGMSGLGRLLPVSVELDGGTADERGSLVGPLCTPGDLLGREIPLPSLAEGDLVTVPNAGAYGPSASLLSFLGRPSPREVALRDDEVVSVSRLEHGRVMESDTE
ncbi:type III PLP-dependent enzyme [Streptomyces spiramenti]|uniref:Type III PLP-dependent enzyme n=1 Tax=Streptomyces spiramenti TaxID=2720606 RepID=A0ABX1AM60_9ACTN|nr:type III PLP-dependent enzyme [Streptomyces spiramenti]NJP66741.1 type III PLP-dependent enzyme [Streptomyces spiramenti]